MQELHVLRALSSVNNFAIEEKAYRTGYGSHCSNVLLVSNVQSCCHWSTASGYNGKVGGFAIF